MGKVTKTIKERENVMSKMDYSYKNHNMFCLRNYLEDILEF